MEGWIKIHWKSKHSAVFQDAVPWAVWTRLLLSASHRRQILRNGTVLERGEALVSSRELAEWAKVSDRTMQRLLRTYEDEGMIRVVKVSRNGTHLSICNWETYQGSNADHVGQMTGNDDATAQQRRSNGAQTKRPKRPKNPAPLPAAASSVEFPDGWGEVGERLRGRGVVRPSEAISAAMANGVEPATAEAIIDHYDDHPRAWEAGALYGRVMVATPDLAPSKGWPEPMAGYHLEARLSERERYYREQQRRREEAARRKEAERQKDAELERQHGAAVDAMDRTEAERILRDRLGTEAAAPFIKTWRVGEPPSGIARDTLIEFLEAGCHV